MPQLAGLPHEAARQHGTIVHMRTTGEDKIIADDPVAHPYRCRLIAVDATVGQTAGTRNIGIVSNTDVLHRSCIQDGYMTTDGSYRRSMFAGIIIGNLFQTGS